MLREAVQRFAYLSREHIITRLTCAHTSATVTITQRSTCRIVIRPPAPLLLHPTSPPYGSFPPSRALVRFVRLDCESHKFSSQFSLPMRPTPVCVRPCGSIKASFPRKTTQLNLAPLDRAGENCKIKKKQCKRPILLALNSLTKSARSLVSAV